MLGSIHVKIKVILSIVQIANVRDDEGVKEIADIIGMKAEGRSTCIIVVANRLLHPALVLFKLDLLL